MVPIRPGTVHVVGRVCDNQPSVRKWEMLTGEEGLGVRGMDLVMIGSERDR